jgi:hypothetical protein
LTSSLSEISNLSGKTRLRLLISEKDDGKTRLRLHMSERDDGKTRLILPISGRDDGKTRLRLPISVRDVSLREISNLSLVLPSYLSER